MEVTASAQAWLEITGGETVPLRENCPVGRSSQNRMVLPDDRVSRRHALIHAQGESEWWLIDLGSSNGTHVNQRRVTRPVQLQDRDVIEIGPFSMTFRTSLGPVRERGRRTLPTRIPERRREVACWMLVADIQGYAQMVKHMSDAEAAMLTGSWFSACHHALDQCGGQINNFLGDGFLAYWPESHQSAAQVREGIELLKRRQQIGPPPFRVVIHHGKVLVGAIPDTDEENLTGRDLIYTFRLEKLAKKLGVSWLISTPAHDRLEDLLDLVDLGRHAVPDYSDEEYVYTLPG